MKNLRLFSFALLLGCFLPVLSYGQMKTVISSIAFQDAQGNVAANGVLSLQLSVPAEISGGGQVAPSRVKITLDGTGKIPAGTTMWASDQLIPAGDTYYAQLQDSTGRYVAQFGNWYIAGASPIDLAQQTPVVVGLSYPNPLILSPSGGANQTVAGAVTITGALTFKTGNNIRIADQFAGADWCAKVTAADSDLGATTVGEIQVSQLANTGGACAAAPTLSKGHALRFTQGGLYQISVGWTQNNAGYWSILGDEMAVISFTGTSGFTIDGSSFAADAQHITLSNVVFSGNSGVANACTFTNVARSYFNRLHCINATTRGMWWRGVVATTMEYSGNSGNIFADGTVAPIQETSMPTTLVDFDQNPGATSASIGNTIVGIIAECGGVASTTGVRLTSMFHSAMLGGTSEGCTTGMQVESGSTDNFINVTDFESNTNADLNIKGAGNKFYVAASSNLANGVHIFAGGNNTWISGDVQNLTADVSVLNLHLESLYYSRTGAAGTITDNTAGQMSKINVVNYQTNSHDSDVLGSGSSPLVLNGAATITSAPPANGILGAGWRLVGGGFAQGVMANGWANDFNGGAWWSWCNGAPGNNASSTVPDTLCFLNILNTGSIWLSESASVPTPTAGKEIIYPDSTAHAFKTSYNGGSFFPVPQTIATGTAAMTTAGIGTGACGTTVTVAATGVLTTDTIDVSRNAAATIGNGGGLTLNWWPTSGNVNFNYCNSSAGTITPTAMTVNWAVRR